MNLYDIVAPMTMAEARTDYEKRRQREKNMSLGEAMGYESDKRYMLAGKHNIYDIYVGKKKFNDVTGFIAVAVHPRTKNAVRFNAPTQQGAVEKAKAEINKIVDTAPKISGQATVDFNIDFKRDILEMSDLPFYAKIIPGPKLVIAGKEMEQYPDIMKSEGFKKSFPRSEKGNKLPGLDLSSSSAKAIQIVANGRYVLGNETIDKDGNRVFDLDLDSTVAGKGDMAFLKTPGFTIGTPRAKNEDAWHAGDNAWSSDKHEMVETEDDWYDDEDEDEETDLRSGDYVRDRLDGEHGEIFRMQGDPYERRVRILDRDDRGWYIEPSRLTRVDPQDPDVQRYFGKKRVRDMDEQGVAEADKTSWTVNVTLKPNDDINQGRGAQEKTMTVAAQSKDAAKKKLISYFLKNGWTVTGIKFTGDLDEARRVKGGDYQLWNKELVDEGWFDAKPGSWRNPKPGVDDAGRALMKQDRESHPDMDDYSWQLGWIYADGDKDVKTAYKDAYYDNPTIPSPPEPRSFKLGFEARSKQGVAEASFTAAASMHAATRKRDPQRQEPKHDFRVGDNVVTKKGKKPGEVVFVDGEKIHVKGTNPYYPNEVTYHTASELKKGVAEGSEHNVGDTVNYSTKVAGFSKSAQGGQGKITKKTATHYTINGKEMPHGHVKSKSKGVSEGQEESFTIDGDTFKVGTKVFNKRESDDAPVSVIVRILNDHQVLVKEGGLARYTVWEIKDLFYADDADYDDGYDDEEIPEGWSDKYGGVMRPPTPYSVYIKGKKWKDFATDDHAQAVANKLRAKFKADGRDPSVITIAPTDYDKNLKEFAPGGIYKPPVIPTNPGKGPFEDDPRSQTVNQVQQLLDAGKSVFVLLPGAKGRAVGTQIGDDHSWLNVQYKGWKDPKTRSRSRLTVNLKADDDASLTLTPGSQFTDNKDRPFDYTLTGSAKTSGRGLFEVTVDEADETSWTANSAQFRKEEDMSWPVEITLEPRADVNKGRGRQVKTMTVTGQSRDAAKKKLVDYFRKNGWAVTSIKFTSDLDEGDDLGNLDAEVFGRIDKEKQRKADLKKNDPAAYAKELEKDSKNYGRGIMGALRRKYDQPIDESDSGDYDYPYNMSARDKGRYDAMTGREYNNPYSAFGTQEDHNNAIEYSAAYDSANEQGVTEAETDYSKRRQREKDIDAGRPVAKQRQSKMTDYQKRRAQDKKDMELGEEKTRLDPKCWTGKKIGNPKTKIKGGVRVNNCVPKESVQESYWTKLQNERNTKLNSLVNELKESINK